MDGTLTQVLVSVILALALILKVVAEMMSKKKNNGSSATPSNTVTFSAEREELFIRKIQDMLVAALNDIPCYRNRVSCGEQVSKTLSKSLDNLQHKVDDLT